MSSEAEHLRAILSAPDEDGPKQAFAAWLAERGDWRAAVIREQPESLRFIVALHASTGTPLEELRALAATKQAERIAAMASFLKVCVESGLGGNAAEVFESTLDSLLDLLTIVPGTASVEVLLEYLSQRDSRSFMQLDFAAKMATGQPLELLMQAFHAHHQVQGLMEFWACLLHEEVLRGRQLGDPPIVDRFIATLHAAGHPLARLPLHRTSVEEALHRSLPNYGALSLSRSLPFGPYSAGAKPLPQQPSGDLPVLSEVTTEALCLQIGKPFHEWMTASNGRVEVREFRALEPLGDGLLSLSLLRSAGLQCLAGCDDESIQTERITAAEVFEILFAAAAFGGAHCSGLQGVYGRLMAWRSMAGLVGTTGHDLDEAARLAEQCRWIRFSAASGFYWQIAWDVGIVAVRPDRMSLVILAATDTA